METELLLATINETHQKLNQALENKDAAAYLKYFDQSLQYTGADSITLDKHAFATELKRNFSRFINIHTSHYRIKSSFSDVVFTEKIARKSIIKARKLLIFSKKQTVQTEEIYHWQNIENEWRIVKVEIVLEENY